MTEYNQSKDVSNEAERLRLLAITADEATLTELESLRDKNFSPARILDAGCGTGDAFQIIQDVFSEAEIVGLDQSDKAVELANARDIASKVVIGDITNELPSDLIGSFDLIFMRNTLLHIPNPVDAIKNLSQGLRENGKLVLQEPDWSFADATWNDFLIFKESITKAMIKHSIDPFVGGKLPAIFEEAGLTVIYKWQYEHTTSPTDEHWEILYALLEVSSGMIGEFLAALGVESVDEMRQRLDEARKNEKNVFNNPAWVITEGGAEVLTK